MSTHTILIAVHALLGVVAFAAGWAVLQRRSLFTAYYWSLAGMAFFLVGAVALRWPELETGTRLLFSGLMLLAAYMVWRGDQARRLRRADPGVLSEPYIHHIGFTLIGLFNGFIIVTVLNGGGPGWLAVVASVLGVIVGRAVMARASAQAATG